MVVRLGFLKITVFINVPRYGPAYGLNGTKDENMKCLGGYYIGHFSLI